MPGNKFSDAERQAILYVCHDSEYVDKPPGQIVPALADKGEFIGSESTYYRVLHEANEQHLIAAEQRRRLEGIHRQVTVPRQRIRCGLGTCRIYRHRYADSSTTCTQYWIFIVAKLPVGMCMIANMVIMRQHWFTVRYSAKDVRTRRWYCMPIMVRFRKAVRCVPSLSFWAYLAHSVVRE